MSKIHNKSREVRNFILCNVTDAPKRIPQRISEEFGLSRQAAHYHLGKLVEGGELVRNGEKKSIYYGLTREVRVNESFKIEDLEEHVVWEDHISSIFADYPKNVKDICYYGFTEMLNNAIDHSESTHVRVVVEESLVDVQMQIYDYGEGIFKRICRLKEFQHEREAIFELSKGKLTTDPENHTGEGIFFSSRMFDYYYIRSGTLYFSHNINDDSDWLLETAEAQGTRVSMAIFKNSTRIESEIFDAYADPEIDPSFNKTVVPIRLADYQGDGLVSRSQAKRILNRFDKFKNVILDFKNVSSIGQGFSDEIFRVFKNANPDIQMSPINMNTRVAAMIKRASGGM